MTDKPGSQRPKRPSGVTVAGWLHLFQCMLLLATGLYLMRVSGVLYFPGGQPELDLSRLVREGSTGAVFVVLSVPVLVVALGLLWLRLWAWLLAMTMQGLGLASALVAYLADRPNYILMALGILIVLDLNQGDVRKAFQPRKKPYV